MEQVWSNKVVQATPVMLTNDGLHIFRVISYIEKVTGTKGVVQRLFKCSKMVKNFGGNESCKLPTPECLIFIQNLAVQEKDALPEFATKNNG